MVNALHNSQIGNMFINNILDRALDNSILGLSQQNILRIKQDFLEKLRCNPSIGLFGKTGVGKSSLCNALFGKEIAEISHVESCTRSEQYINIDYASSGGVELIDVPGVGENSSRDQEYARLYAELLPKTDVVLWLLKADERAYSQDIEFFNQLVKPLITQGKPFFIVLSQADKIEPFREWDEAAHSPGKQQAKALQEKVRIVANNFGVTKHQVIPVSSAERFQLDLLMEQIIKSLPTEKKIITYSEAQRDTLNDESKKEASDSFFNLLKDVVCDVVGEIAESVVALAGNVLKFIFG